MTEESLPAVMVRLPATATATATVEPWLVVEDSSSLLAWRSIKVTALPTVMSCPAVMDASPPVSRPEPVRVTSRPAVACKVLVALMPDARVTRDCDALAELPSASSTLAAEIMSRPAVLTSRSRQDACACRCTQKPVPQALASEILPNQRCCLPLRNAFPCTHMLSAGSPAKKDCGKACGLILHGCYSLQWVIIRK